MPHLFSSCCCSALLSPLVSGISHQPPPTHLSHRCGCRPAVAEHDEYYADLINKAVEGAGTDEKLLARVIVSRRHLLPGINKAFMHKYEKTIKVRTAPLRPALPGCHPPLPSMPHRNMGLPNKSCSCLLDSSTVAGTVL